MVQNALTALIDDKNKIEVGEPNYPISAVTRGKRVLVFYDQNLQTSEAGLKKLFV